MVPIVGKIIWEQDPLNSEEPIKPNVYIKINSVYLGNQWDIKILYLAQVHPFRTNKQVEGTLC